MRHFPVSAALSAIVLALASPALAQDAGDCGMMCRLQDYLSTDHMTAGPGEPAAAAPTKPRQAHAARKKAPGSVAQAKAPAPAAQATSVPAARKPAPAVRTAVEPPPAPKREAARERVKVEARIATPPAKPAVLLSPVDVAKRVKIARTAPPVTAAPAPPARPRTAAAAGPRVAAVTAPTRTAFLSSPIPGSAPTVQAGFH